MINFFKIFINMLYGLFTMGMIALVVWGANWAVNTGGESHDVPNLIANENDDPERTIYFSDVIAFNVTSILNAHKSHEIFLGNRETGEEYILWDIVPVGWFNRSVTWTKNVGIAVLSPSHEMEQMDRYRYALFIAWHPEKAHTFVTIDSSDINFYNYRDVDLNIVGLIYGNRMDPIAVGTIVTMEQVKANGNWRLYWSIHTKADFQFDNVVRRFDKYNHEDYDQFEKFLINKPVAKWAFSQIIIIFTLTAFIVYQNPINFTKTPAGGTEMNKSIFPRIPMPRRRIRKYPGDYEDGRR